MRIVDPSLDSPWRGRPGDDLDRLLSDFFRSELPHPWPEAKIPDEQPKSLPARKSSPRWATFRSRFALAASIALLLVGGWFLSGRFEEVPGSGSLGNRNEATPHFDGPKGRLKEDEPRIRQQRIFVDPSGRAGVQFEVDFP